MAKPNRWIEFLRLASIETDECVPWPYGCQGDGYGVVHVAGEPGATSRLTHRLVLERRVGSCPPGMVAAHAPGVCHNPRCMNVRHLRWDTEKANQADKITDGTTNRGERSATARLTADQVRAIRSRIASGESQRSLAREFGVSHRLVRGIVHRQKWAWLD